MVNFFKSKTVLKNKNHYSEFGYIKDFPQFLLILPVVASCTETKLLNEIRNVFDVIKLVLHLSMILL